MQKQLSKPTSQKLNQLLANTGDMALKRRARRIIEEINPRANESILEIGCGDGFYLHILNGLGIRNIKLTGTDIDKNAIKSAKRNLHNNKIILLQNDLMKGLPFKANIFDKIIMSEVCEHLSDDLKGLKEARRVLKESGIIVITVPNLNYPFLWDPINWTLQHFFKTHIKRGVLGGIWNQHLRLYSKKDVETLVKDARLVINLSQSLTFWCLPFNHIIMNLAAIGLHSGNISGDLKDSINKFKNVTKKPSLITNAFRIVNYIDKLNDFYTPRNSGVGVLAVAQK